MAVQIKDDYMLVRMPAALKRKIRAKAYREGTNMTAIVVGILAETFDVPYESRSNRTAPFGGGRQGS